MKKKGQTVGCIFARGGSKGVPRKNIRILAGKPLIAYAIESAKECPLVDRVLVSTDDPEIAEVSRKFGAEIPFLRPSELAKDDSSEWLAWQHAIQFLQQDRESDPLDLFVSVPTTSPLRTSEDLSNCIQTLKESDADIVITTRKAERSPYFNMITLNEKGYAQLIIPPSSEINRRQDTPQVFDMTTVAYVAKPDFILSARSLFEGKVKTVLIPTERAIDIDTELDFKIAEFLMQKKV